MVDWTKLTDKELADLTEDPAAIESETDEDREKLQIEICKRAGQKFERPDGSVGYEPPDWKGD